jgi:hypothetical protein
VGRLRDPESQRTILAVDATWYRIVPECPTDRRRIVRQVIPTNSSFGTIQVDLAIHDGSTRRIVHTDGAIPLLATADGTRAGLYVGGAYVLMPGWYMEARTDSQAPNVDVGTSWADELGDDRSGSLRSGAVIATSPPGGWQNFEGTARVPAGHVRLVTTIQLYNFNVATQFHFVASEIGGVRTSFWAGQIVSGGNVSTGGGLRGNGVNALNAGERLQYNGATANTYVAFIDYKPIPVA